MLWSYYLLLVHGFVASVLQMNSFKKEVDGMFGGNEKEQVYLDDTPDVQYSKVLSSTTSPRSSGHLAAVSTPACRVL